MRSVLVVDDKDYVRRALQDILGERGWDVTLAATKAEALERIAGHQWDVVLSDYDLGWGENGLDVLQAASPVAVTVLMSAIPRDMEIRQFGWEPDGFVDKGIHMAEIPDQLERIYLGATVE